jgi:hypothetical protein
MTTTKKRGLRAVFRCARIDAFVEPTGDVVEQKGQRYQRMKVRARREHPRFLWVPIDATRWDIENMLEIEYFDGNKNYALPIVTDLRTVA